MAQKVKKQKAKPQQKVVRFKPNINLLKHLNAVLLITGFFASLFTVFLLSGSDRYDTRSRGQAPQNTVVPSLTPSASPSPQISPVSDY